MSVKKGAFTGSFFCALPDSGMVKNKGSFSKKIHDAKKFLRAEKNSADRTLPLTHYVSVK